MVHPIFERIEVDSAHRYAVSGYVQQPAEKSFSWTVKADDDDGIQLHK
jgi:hypothetical protein